MNTITLYGGQKLSVLLTGPAMSQVHRVSNCIDPWRPVKSLPKHQIKKLTSKKWCRQSKMNTCNQILFVGERATTINVSFEFNPRIQYVK